MIQPKLIIHGGFFSESHTDAATKKAKQDALTAIARKAHAYLLNHTALETVVYANELLENDALFNAGTGSQIQSDGQVRMSASIMDGISQKFSGVINIQEVQNPIRVAELLLDYDDRVLGGEGATVFARRNGFKVYDVRTEQRKREYAQKLAGTGSGTVGCVALDASGALAAATSTGGKGFEMVGRISDSATTAGNYCNAHCGISCTGVGEDIVSAALATKIVTRVTDGLAIHEAFYKSFSEMKAYDGFAGAIGISAKGEIYHLDSHPSMVYAWTDGSELAVFQ
ncbi:MAG: isoaspartyl peptidase/L-asparaginase [Bacteroidia bacterium]